MSEMEEQFSQPEHWIEGEPTEFKTLHAQMTLRDWFAGQALAGMVISEAASSATIEAAAAHFYRIADAMLEARAARTGEAA